MALLRERASLAKVKFFDQSLEANKMSKKKRVSNKYVSFFRMIQTLVQFLIADKLQFKKNNIYSYLKCFISPEYSKFIKNNFHVKKSWKINNKMCEFLNIKDLKNINQCSKNLISSVEFKIHSKKSRKLSNDRNETELYFSTEFLGIKLKIVNDTIFTNEQTDEIINYLKNTNLNESFF